MKDLLEHIRTVHFTLLVIMLTLFVASIHQPRLALQRAERDIRGVGPASASASGSERLWKQAATSAAEKQLEGKQQKPGWVRFSFNDGGRDNYGTFRVMNSWYCTGRSSETAHDSFDSLFPESRADDVTLEDFFRG